MVMDANNKGPVIYHAGHYAYISKFIVHKLKNHKKEPAIILFDCSTCSDDSLSFLVNSTDELLKIGVSIIIYNDRQEFGNYSDKKELIYAIREYFDNLLSEVTTNNSPTYSGYDSRNAFCIYLNLIKQNYIVFDDGLFNTVKGNKPLTIRNNCDLIYSQLIKEYNVLSYQNEYVTKVIWFNSQITNIEKQSENFDFYATLNELGRSEVNFLINLYGIKELTKNKNNNTLIVFSGGWSLKNNHATRSEYYALYQRIIAHYCSSDDNVIIKTHPNFEIGNIDMFTYFNNVEKISGHVPFELLLSDNVNINRIITTSDTVATYSHTIDIIALSQSIMVDYSEFDIVRSIGLLNDYCESHVNYKVQNSKKNLYEKINVDCKNSNKYECCIVDEPDVDNMAKTLLEYDYIVNLQCNLKQFKDRYPDIYTLYFEVETRVNGLVDKSFFSVHTKKIHILNKLSEYTTSFNKNGISFSMKTVQRYAAIIGLRYMNNIEACKTRVNEAATESEKIEICYKMNSVIDCRKNCIDTLMATKQEENILQAYNIAISALQQEDDLYYTLVCARIRANKKYSLFNETEFNYWYSVACNKNKCIYPEYIEKLLNSTNPKLHSKAFRLAKEHIDVYGCSGLVARMLYLGKGIECNIDESIDYYSAAFKESISWADEYSKALLKTKNPSNYKKALDICLAVKDRIKNVLPIIGEIYRMGLGVDADLNKAERWYSKALDQKVRGCKYDYYQLLWDINTISSLEKLITLLSTDYENGDAGSTGMLARCSSQGVGVTADMTKAIELYEIASKKKPIWTRELVKTLIDSEAIEYVEKAIQICNNNKDPMLKVYLGRLYRDGIGVPKDNSVAMKLFKEAMDNGVLAGKKEYNAMIKHGGNE